MIRDHGPGDSTQKLCLFAVNAFMKDGGDCYPSQRAIAKAAGLAEYTVQKAIAAILEAGWLCAETHKAKGKAWKRYSYRASVPDALADCETMHEQKISDLVLSHESVHGPLPAWGRPLKKSNALRNGSNNGPHSHEQGPHSGWSIRPHSDAEGPHSDAKVVPIQSGTKFLSEVPIRSSNSSKLQKEGAALARSTGTEDHLKMVGEEKRKAKEKETPKRNAEEAEASKEILGRIERGRKVRKALKAFPNDGDADIAKMAGVTLSEVQEVRRQA
jgi:Helix-turn-helix domain